MNVKLFKTMKLGKKRAPEIDPVKMVWYRDARQQRSKMKIKN